VASQTVAALLQDLHHLPDGPFGRALRNPLPPRRAAGDRNSPASVSSPELR
jgi:hypothetical protein